MKAVLFFLILLTGIPAFAQKSNGTVKGMLQDSASAQPLPDATISVFTTDSTLITSVLSAEKGVFQIQSLAAGNYYLQISFQGYETTRKTFSISERKKVQDFGIIKILKSYTTLSEVIIRDETPIKVKGDTVAYDSKAFKVLNPNGTAEDLLKKLPGVLVDRDGSIKAHGETVQKIYVDGKEFFGNDPKMATKNITADMIDQVEVFDDRSEQSKFSGVDDGSRTRVMNFKLKKDKNKGVYGRASGGYGTDNRYQANVSANYFKGATKLSIISRSNNTNNIGFTNNDMLGIYSGGGGRGNSGGSGITKTATAGINYSDLWGKKLEFTGSYFFNHLNTTNISKSASQNFFKDSTVNRVQQGFSNSNNNNHRINFKMIYSIDSMNSIVYIPTANFQNSDSYTTDSTISYMSGKGDSMKVNDSRSVRQSKGSGANWSNDLTFRHKTHKFGRTFSINFSSGGNNSNRQGSTASRIGMFMKGDKLKDSLINQVNFQDNHSDNYGINFSYTEPLAKDKMLELNYSHNKNNNQSNRKVYDYDTLTGVYSKVNYNQTNLFQNSSEWDRAGTNYRVVTKNYNYQAGIAAQRSTLESNNLSKNTFIRQTFFNFFPTASYNYQFSRSKAFRFMYRGSTNQPSTTQLQETTDKTNALYWTKGNAALKQEYNNNVSLVYNNFNMQTFRNLFFRVTFSNTYNKIVNNVLSGPRVYKGDTITRGVQLTTPVNANGAYAVNGNFNVGFPITKLQGGNFNTTTTVGYSHDVSFADSVFNFAKNINLGENLRLSYTYKEKLDLVVGAGVTYTAAQYTLNAFRSNAYYTYTATGSLSYIFPEDFILSSDIDYIAYSGLTSGYNKPFALWNASFGKQVLKNKRGELKLSLFDILKQNRSVSRNFGSNYIEDVQNSTVQQFYMLTFTYNLKRVGTGSKNSTDRGDRNDRGERGERNFRRM